MKTKMVLFLFVLCTMAGSLFGQVNGNQNETQKVAILDVVDKEGNIPYAIKLLIRSKLTAAIYNEYCREFRWAFWTTHKCGSGWGGDYNVCGWGETKCVYNGNGQSAVIVKEK